MQKMLYIVIISVLIGIYLLFSRNKPDNNYFLDQISDSDVIEEVEASNNPNAIENLRNRSYEGSKITIEETIESNSLYTSYRISYFSDGLKIFAAMNAPNGAGPFPVVILNHGYFNPSTFNTGDGTKSMAAILAENGYFTLASDYRGHGESESDGVERGHRPEYAVDVLNLIASVGSIRKADPKKIGIWGHSMGGEVTMKTIEVNNKINAAVLWAPTSGDAQRNYDRWSRRHVDNLDNSGAQSFDESSSGNYLKYISTPIQLHHGTADTEVPYEWSAELNQNLTNAGKEVEFFTYEGQDHNFRNYGWSEISPRTVEFFDKHLK